MRREQCLVILLWSDPVDDEKNEDSDEEMKMQRMRYKVCPV